MASLHLGAASLINEDVFGSSLIGFRSKRFRRVSERWKIRAQQMLEKEQRTQHELARFAKRSESLRRILKQYGVSVETPEENKTSSRLDDLNFEEKHHDDVPSSVIDDAKMNTTEELPDLRQQEKYSETVSTADNLSGHDHHNLPHLNTGVLFTSLLPVLGFCIVCIIGTLHTIISRKPSQDHHHGSKTTRWRTALIDWNEPLASDEHDSSPEYRVASTNQEANDEMNEAYNRVELEYKRFLLECGVSES
ncbi:unnamed protein product [Arabidopsis lyrata]|uniref:Transmembrane protein n=1 Tax=Arabidopsis lyrata subsp. lyrata TaxID=81972 RepID=D7LXZ3_ARALL|nr:uncharacterized protein LOC9310665 [Arabidopsis lyrata subsp. lyrata]EFH48740.1 hypothetical protein ARALYDRAFT_327172 [Arabidopsis lyrata subsp. lyrata]CAH8272777.1 unnamed protein product [Arabidopsis lyrata]|eukprot:XP_002872481.1 uncharacterized protein LOC9310665 [Arabidopsis lyrata subsp. lyrata]